MLKNWKLVRLCVCIVLVLSLVSVLISSTAAASVTPVVVDGNPNCVGLGYTYGFKPQPEPPPSGTYPFPGDPANSVTITSDGTTFSWTSTLGIDAVIVKGGNNANVYAYNPEATSDTQLNAPINPNNGKPFGISHIDFCYDYEVVVTKDATTSFVRTYDWNIQKVGDQSALTLSLGQSFTVNYDVTVSVTGSADSGWKVTGTIAVYNPDPTSVATVTGVTDVLTNGGSYPGNVDCGASFPIALAPKTTLNCTYEIDLSLVGAVNGTNTATAATSGKVGGGSGTATVTFGNPTTTVNECIQVDDDLYGPLGQVCVGEAPKTFSYSQTVGPYATCGDYEFVNNASFTGDTDSGSASWTVDVNVPCTSGCTLTQGYWKTHSSLGPAPYDNTWALLPGGQGVNTLFFDTGKSWYTTFRTPPAGNAFYILAHQYMAAVLNQLNGATVPPAIQTAMTQAATLLNQYDTNQGAIKGSLKNQFTTLAATLDSYNNGNQGVPHCSEQQ